MSDHHGSTETLPNETYINTKAVVLCVFVASVLIIPPMITGAYGIFRMLSQEVMLEAVYSVPHTEYLETTAEWDKQLNSYGVVDKETSRYRMPVSDAAKLYVKDVEARIAAAETAAVEPENAEDPNAGDPAQ